MKIMSVLLLFANTELFLVLAQKLCFVFKLYRTENGSFPIIPFKHGYRLVYWQYNRVLFEYKLPRSMTAYYVSFFLPAFPASDYTYGTYLA